MHRKKTLKHEGNVRLHLEDDKNKKQADKKLQIQKIVIFQACCDSLSTSGIQEVCSSEQRNTKDLTLKMFDTHQLNMFVLFHKKKLKEGFSEGPRA